MGLLSTVGNAVVPGLGFLLSGLEAAGDASDLDERVTSKLKELTEKYMSNPENQTFTAKDLRKGLSTLTEPGQEWEKITLNYMLACHKIFIKNPFSTFIKLKSAVPMFSSSKSGIKATQHYINKLMLYAFFSPVQQAKLRQILEAVQSGDVESIKAAVNKPAAADAAGSSSVPKEKEEFRWAWGMSCRKCNYSGKSGTIRKCTQCYDYLICDDCHTKAERPHHLKHNHKVVELEPLLWNDPQAGHGNNVCKRCHGGVGAKYVCLDCDFETCSFCYQCDYRCDKSHQLIAIHPKPESLPDSAGLVFDAWTSTMEIGGEESLPSLQDQAAACKVALMYSSTMKDGQKKFARETVKKAMLQAETAASSSANVALSSGLAVAAEADVLGEVTAEISENQQEFEDGAKEKLEEMSGIGEVKDQVKDGLMEETGLDQLHDIMEDIVGDVLSDLGMDIGSDFLLSALF